MGTSMDSVLAAVLDSTEKQNALVDQSSEVIQKAKEQSNDASAQALEAISGGAGTGMVDGHFQTEDVVRARTTADLEKQKQTSEFAAMLGADSRVSGAAISSLAAMAPQAELQAANEAKILADKAAVGFTDSPPEWLMNQFTHSHDVARADAANRLATTISQGIARLNNSVQQTAVTNELIKGQYSAAGAQSEIKASIANLSLRLAQQTQDNVGKNVNFTEALVRMGGEEVRNFTTQLQAVTSSASFKLQQLASADAHRNSEQEFGIRKQKMDWETADRTELTYLAQTVRDGAEAVKVKLPDLPDHKIIALLKGKNSTYEALSKVGIDTASFGMTYLGGDTTDVARKLISGNYPLSPEQAPVKALYDAAELTVLKTPALELQTLYGVPNITNPENKALAVGKAAQIMSKQQRTDPRIPGDKTNMFNYTGTLDALAATQKGVAESPLYDKVLKNAKLQSFDMELMMNIAGPQIRTPNNPKGTITVEEFSLGMATIASAAAAKVIGLTQPGGLGIVPEGHFPIMLKTGLFGNNQSYEATKPTDWTKALIKSRITDNLMPRSPADLTGSVD